jgi:hypothetical protein
VFDHPVILFYELAFLLNGLTPKPVSFLQRAKLIIMSISTKMNLLRICPAPHPKKKRAALVFTNAHGIWIFKGLKKENMRKTNQGPDVAFTIFIYIRGPFYEQQLTQSVQQINQDGQHRKLYNQANLPSSNGAVP